MAPSRPPPRGLNLVTNDPCRDGVDNPNERVARLNRHCFHAFTVFNWTIGEPCWTRFNLWSTILVLLSRI